VNESGNLAQQIRNLIDRIDASGGWPENPKDTTEDEYEAP
jgi:hypothetical protein